MNVSTAPAAPTPKKWTILQYAAADNNLHDFICQDIAQMETVGSDAQTNLVVQLDDPKLGATRYLLQKDGTVAPDAPTHIDSPALENLGPVNSSDPKVLADFLKWGMEKYPAENYMLVISDHGKGWKGCVVDDSHKGWMTLPDLKQGLESAYQATGKRLDIIGFDACLMASTEVAYQLRDEARYLVASQEIEGQEGWPYDALLKPEALTQLQMSAVGQQDVGARSLAKALVARAGSNDTNLPTFSAVDLSKMEDVAGSLKEFKNQLMALPDARKDLRILRSQTQAFNDYNDLYHFAEKISQSQTVTAGALKESAQHLRNSLDSAIIAEQHSQKYPNAHGLTVELKFARGPYAQTDLEKAVGWSDAVSFLNS